MELASYRPSVEKLYNRPGFIEHNPGNAGCMGVHQFPPWTFLTFSCEAVMARLCTASMTYQLFPGRTVLAVA